MPFSYYKKLSLKQKRIYDQSDAVPQILIPEPKRFAPYLETLRTALLSDNLKAITDTAQNLITILTRLFRVQGVRVHVLAYRPSRNWGELHGLYEFEGKLVNPRISVWMRTAKLGKVVAFRTFLRTLLHELVHHLDYTLLKLADSFHTEGFYKRESSLLKQLLGEWNPKERSNSSTTMISRKKGPQG